MLALSCLFLGIHGVKAQLNIIVPEDTVSNISKPVVVNNQLIASYSRTEDSLIQYMHVHLSSGEHTINPISNDLSMQFVSWPYSVLGSDYLYGIIRNQENNIFFVKMETDFSIVEIIYELEGFGRIYKHDGILIISDQKSNGEFSYIDLFAYDPIQETTLSIGSTIQFNILGSGIPHAISYDRVEDRFIMQEDFFRANEIRGENVTEISGVIPLNIFDYYFIDNIHVPIVQEIDFYVRNDTSFIFQRLDVTIHEEDNSRVIHSSNIDGSESRLDMSRDGNLFIAGYSPQGSTKNCNYNFSLFDTLIVEKIDVKQEELIWIKKMELNTYIVHFQSDAHRAISRFVKM